MDPIKWQTRYFGFSAPALHLPPTFSELTINLIYIISSTVNNYKHMLIDH